MTIGAFSCAPEALQPFGAFSLSPEALQPCGHNKKLQQLLFERSASSGYSSGFGLQVCHQRCAITRMQSVMNLKIKYRESFRPFAPSALRGYVADWFEMDIDSSYMLLVADVAEKRPRKMTAEEEKLWGIEKLSGGFGYVSLADKRANFSNVDFAGQENLPGLHHKHNITLPGVGGWQLI